MNQAPEGLPNPERRPILLGMGTFTGGRTFYAEPSISTVVQANFHIHRPLAAGEVSAGEGCCAYGTAGGASMTGGGV